MPVQSTELNAFMTVPYTRNHLSASASSLYLTSKSRLPKQIRRVDNSCFHVRKLDHLSSVPNILDVISKYRVQYVLNQFVNYNTCADVD